MGSKVSGRTAEVALVGARPGGCLRRLGRRAKTRLRCRAGRGVALGASGSPASVGAARS